MSLQLRGRAVVSIVAVLVLVLGASMTIQYRLMKAQAVAVRDAELAAEFRRYRNAIDDFTDNQGAKAAALAQLGAWVYDLERGNPTVDAPEVAMELALSQLRSVSDPAILGGGIWYEPYVLESDKRWVGPYAVVDGSGRARPDWEYSTDEYSYSTHDWYTIAVPEAWDRSRQRLRDLYMTEPYMDSLGGRPTVFITFTHVMYGPDRRIIGVSTADWTFDSLKQTLSEFRATESSFAFLVHEPSRKILFPVDRAELATVEDSAWGAFVDLAAAREGEVERVHDIQLDGHRYDLSYTKTRAGFIFGQFVATDEAYAFVREGARNNLALALVTLVLVGLATLWVVSRLLRPIRELSRSARIIAAGDLDHVAEVTTRDEVGELAVAFNAAHERARSDAAALEEAAAKLRGSEEHFRALIENATDIVMVISSDGAIRYASPSLRRVLGRTPERVVDTSLLSYIHDDDVEHGDAALNSLWTGESSVECFELRLSHTDGTWPTFEAIGARLNENTVLNARDVSARKAAERALRESESKLRQAAKLEAVGRLAGGIAHDFNNALTIMIGSSQLVRRRVRGDDGLEHTLDEIVAAGQHAASLTRRLLTFSRHHVAERRAISLNDTVAEIEPLLRRLIGEDIQLSSRLGTTVTAIHADTREVEQVLLNLGANARDAMPEGGALVIGTSNQAITASLMSVNGEITPGEYNVLSVTDSGVGMDALTISRVFDPFFTTKSADLGTGLGLSTVYGIANDSGGYILVDSEPGEGTRFQIYWPARSQPVGRQPVDEATLPRGQGETVLVVEDDDRVRRSTVAELEAAGFEVVEARDGVEALEVVRAGEHVDLVVTDVVMPRMKGPRLATELEALRPGIPVVFVSGYVAGELDAQRMESPRYEYLQKPFTPGRLCGAVRRLLDDAVAERRRREASDRGVGRCDTKT